MHRETRTIADRLTSPRMIAVFFVASAGVGATLYALGTRYLPRAEAPTLVRSVLAEENAPLKAKVDQQQVEIQQFEDHNLADDADRAVLLKQLHWVTETVHSIGERLHLPDLTDPPPAPLVPLRLHLRHAAAQGDPR